MKVYLPNDSKMGIGGGWRFRENLIKGSSKYFQVIDSLAEADISLIAGATMILPDTFTKLKEKTKVILRLDGVPEFWRNDGRVWGRFKHYFENSDGIVCQSDFVKNTTYDWLHMITREGTNWCVIMNGVDKDVFRPDGDRFDFGKGKIVLNINSRKDENKRIEEVIVRYRYEKLLDRELKIIFAGKYPTYLMKNQFGLYDYENDRDWQYFGMLQEPKLVAKLMRSCDEFWFPSFADPAPNSVIEAIHTMGVEKIKYFNEFGGVKEIIDLYKSDYDFGLENMDKKYYQFFQSV